MTQAMATQAGQGEARWWFAALAEIKATAADTGGLLTIVEVTEPPGAEAPLHVHHREDEGFWILEGEVTLYVGDETIEASAGDFVWGPRDIPHRYTVGPNGCRMLFIPSAQIERLVSVTVPGHERVEGREEAAAGTFDGVGGGRAGHRRAQRGVGDRRRVRAARVRRVQLVRDPQ